MLIGGKINKIVQPNTDSVIFTIYKGKIYRLFVSADPSSPRINLLDSEQEAPLTAPNFCMLLRKHLSMATIQKIELVGFDRIVKITLSCSQEFFDAKEKSLYVELMGRYSNVILTEKGKVLGGNRGVNFFDNGVRPLIVNRDYTLPPKGDKKEPFDTLLIETFKANSDMGVKALITTFVQGFATSTASEIEREFLSNFNGENFAESLFLTLQSFIIKKNKKPCIILTNSGMEVCAFPYQSIDGKVMQFNKLYEAEEYYFLTRQKDKKKKDLFDRLSSVVNTNEKKIRKRLSAILSREKDALKADENRLFGELLLANIYKVKQGDEFVEVDNYYDNTKVKILLDKNLSPSKNAENFYKKYNKQKRALEMLAIQKEQAERELEYLTSVKEELALCETLSDLVFVKEELISEGILKEQRTPNRKKDTQLKFRRYEIQGFTVKVGRNNTENDELTITAKGSDIWVHSKDYHSSHAIIESRGAKIPNSVIEKVASICAYYSKGREGGKSEVVYTERRFVKKPKKAKAGFFIYTDYTTITVLPNRYDNYLK